MLIFYFFALVVLWLGVLSLRGGIKFARYVRTETARDTPDFHPFVSVIAPCSGLDQGFRENVAAFLHQDYPNYELIFVTSSASDPAVREIQSVQSQVKDSKPSYIRFITSGPATDSGQKVHNLQMATRNVDARSEVFVFVDSDARVPSHWLRSLVAPLADKELGAATGYRWFIPVKGGFSSHLRSVWNASIASALGANRRKNFCWGGSTAVRRELFEQLRIRERWQGTVSDDFTLTRVMQEAKLPIHFVPSCIVPSLEDCGPRELLEFTNRQLKITHVYARHLWQPVLVGSLLFSAVFFGGVALVVVNAVRGRLLWPTVALLAAILFLGAAKSLIRLRSVEVPLAAYQKELRRSTLAHATLWPVASLLYLVNAVTAGFSNVIEWRGITYQLKSPTQAVIISRRGLREDVVGER